MPHLISPPFRYKIDCRLHPAERDIRQTPDKVFVEWGVQYDHRTRTSSSSVGIDGYDWFTCTINLYQFILALGEYLDMIVVTLYLGHRELHSCVFGRSTIEAQNFILTSPMLPFERRRGESQGTVWLRLCSTFGRSNKTKGLELPYRLNFRFNYSREVDARLEHYHPNFFPWTESMKQSRDSRESDSQRHRSPLEEGEIRPDLATTIDECLRLPEAGGEAGGSSAKINKKTTEQESTINGKHNANRAQVRRVRRLSHTPPFSAAEARQAPAIPAAGKPSESRTVVDSEDEDVIVAGLRFGKAAILPGTDDSIAVEDKDRNSAKFGSTRRLDEEGDMTSFKESNTTTLRQEGSRAGPEGSASDQTTILDMAEDSTEAKEPQGKEQPVCVGSDFLKRMEEARRKRLLLEAENAALEKEVAEKEAMKVKEAEEEEARLEQAEAMNEMLKRKKARLIRPEPKGVVHGTIGNAV